MFSLILHDCPNLFYKAMTLCVRGRLRQKAGRRELGRVNLVGAQLWLRQASGCGQAAGTSNPHFKARRHFAYKARNNKATLHYDSLLFSAL